MLLSKSMNFKYKRALIKIKLKKHDRTIKSLNKNQQYAYDIIKHVINSRYSSLYIDNTLFIKKDKILCRIATNKVQVAYYGYKYDVFMPDNVIVELQNEFYKESKRRIKIIEKEIHDNTEAGLKSICNKLM